MHFYINDMSLAAQLLGIPSDSASVLGVQTAIQETAFYVRLFSYEKLEITAYLAKLQFGPCRKEGLHWPVAALT